MIKIPRQFLIRPRKVTFNDDINKIPLLFNENDIYHRICYGGRALKMSLESAFERYDILDSKNPVIKQIKI